MNPIELIRGIILLIKEIHMYIYKMGDEKEEKKEEEKGRRREKKGKKGGKLGAR